MNKNAALMALAVALLTGLAIAVYLPGLTGGFALDDYTNVAQNSAIAIEHLNWDSLSHAAFSFQAGPIMRPISMLSFALNAYYTGIGNAGAFKATNLAIHLCNGLLVIGLLWQLLATYRRELAPAVAARSLDWLAIVAGGLWLLHPLNAMPVLYVVQRETALSSLFMLVGLNLYLLGRNRRGIPGLAAIWIGVPTATVLAVLCKESGALLPVYTLAVEIFIFRFRRPGGGFDRPLGLFYLLFLVLPGCLGLTWAFLSHGALNYSGRDFTLGERLLSEARVVWLYIRWTLFPDPAALGLYHDDIAPSHGLLQPVTTLFALLGLIALVITCVMLRRRLPLVAFGIAWFLGGQLMESTIFPLELAFEHRCYLPDLGLILATLSLIWPLYSLRLAAPRYAVVLLALAGCAAATWVRADDWSDNLSFAASEARHHPLSPYATYMLGQTYANLALMNDRAQYDNAVRALEAASAVPNSSVISDVSLVLVEAQLRGRVDPEVMPRIAAKVADRRLTASDIQGLAALGECVDKGNCRVPRRAMQAVFDSALANPHMPELRDTHANVLVIFGNFTAQTDLRKARGLMVQAADLVPSEPQYRINVVTMDISMGDREQAEKDLEAVRRLNYLGHLDAVIGSLGSQIDALPGGAEQASP